jgi:hypothetical protein
MMPQSTLWLCTLSDRAGSLEERAGHVRYSYRMSKAALNMGAGSWRVSGLDVSPAPVSSPCIPGS